MKIWKTKEGEKISFKEFISRWKVGIEGITPLQKEKIKLTGTKITLLGLFLGLCVTIYGWRDLWWVAIILIGAILNTGVQYLATKQQKKLYQTIEDNFKEAEEPQDDIPQKELENVKTLPIETTSNSFEPKTNRLCDSARNEKSKAAPEINNKYGIKGGDVIKQVSGERVDDVGIKSLETNSSETEDISKELEGGINKCHIK